MDRIAISNAVSLSIVLILCVSAFCIVNIRTAEPPAFDDADIYVQDQAHWISVEKRNGSYLITYIGHDASIKTIEAHASYVGFAADRERDGDMELLCRWYENAPIFAGYKLYASDLEEYFKGPLYSRYAGP